MIFQAISILKRHPVLKINSSPANTITPYMKAPESSRLLFILRRLQDCRYGVPHLTISTFLDSPLPPPLSLHITHCKELRECRDETSGKMIVISLTAYPILLSRGIGWTFCKLDSLVLEGPNEKVFITITSSRVVHCLISSRKTTKSTSTSAWWLAFIALTPLKSIN